MPIGGILAANGMSVWDFTYFYTSQSTYNAYFHRYFP